MFLNEKEAGKGNFQLFPTIVLFKVNMCIILPEDRQIYYQENMSTVIEISRE